MEARGSERNSDKNIRVTCMFDNQKKAYAENCATHSNLKVEHRIINQDCHVNKEKVFSKLPQSQENEQITEWWMCFDDFRSMENASDVFRIFKKKHKTIK